MEWRRAQDLLQDSSKVETDCYPAGLGTTRDWISWSWQILLHHHCDGMMVGECWWPSQCQQVLQVMAGTDQPAGGCRAVWCSRGAQTSPRLTMEHCKLNLVTVAISIGSCYPNHDICSLVRHKTHNYLTRCYCTTIVIMKLSIELILCHKAGFW